jgi:hypothetical protein
MGEVNLALKGTCPAAVDHKIRTESHTQQERDNIARYMPSGAKKIFRRTRSLCLQLHVLLIDLLLVGCGHVAVYINIQG